MFFLVDVHWNPLLTLRDHSKGLLWYYGPHNTKKQESTFRGFNDGYRARIE